MRDEAHYVTLITDIIVRKWTFTQPANPEVMVGGDDAALERCKVLLLRIERATTKQAVGSLASTLPAWRYMVSNSPHSAALLAPLLQYVEATAGEDFTDEGAAVRERIEALEGGTARQLSAAVLLQLLEEYIEEVLHPARAAYVEQQRAQRQQLVDVGRSVQSRTWRASGGVAGPSNSAFATDVSLVEQRIREHNDKLAGSRRIHPRDAHSAAQTGFEDGLLGAESRSRGFWDRRVKRPLLRGRGYIVLQPGVRLAREQLDDARDAGLIQCACARLQPLTSARAVCELSRTLLRPLP
jgi:hypothetical protein